MAILLGWEGFLPVNAWPLKLFVVLYLLYLVTCLGVASRLRVGKGSCPYSEGGGGGGQVSLRVLFVGAIVIFISNMVPAIIGRVLGLGFAP